jgi:hypothetical protein
MPEPVEGLVREFLRAVFSGDAAGLSEVALPHPGLADLARPRPAPPHVGSLTEQLAGLQGSVLFETPDRMALHAYFRGMIFPLTLRRGPAGWRVDARFWIAATRPPTEEGRAAKAFMYAVLAGDRELLAEVALPHPALDVLLGAVSPPGERGHLEDICENLPMMVLAPGDEYPITPDRSAPVRAEQVGPDRAFLLTELDGFEVPLPLHREEGRWRVDPGPWVRLCILFRGGSVTPAILL